jgi:hypothetical protein
MLKFEELHQPFVQSLHSTLVFSYFLIDIISIKIVDDLVVLDFEQILQVFYHLRFLLPNSLDNPIDVVLDILYLGFTLFLHLLLHFLSEFLLIQLLLSLR